MKKKVLIPFLISFVLFLSVCTFSQAQLSTGCYRLGGSIAFTSSSTNYEHASIYDVQNEKSSTISISPTLSYFLIDNLELGGVLSYFYSDYSYNYYDELGRNHQIKNYYSGYNIGPTARLYFPSGNLAPFVLGAFEYGESGRQGRDKSISRRTDLGVGLEIFITSYAAIEPNAYYEFINDDWEDGHTIYVGLGVSFLITP